jgi:hypothetical protein
MPVVLRTFLQLLSASTGKRTLLSIAIISLAVIVFLIGVSFRNGSTEDELTGALPILPPAGPTELQSARPLTASTSPPPAGDAETAMQSSAVSWELVPSPRPRPVHKPPLRRAHNMRRVPDNLLPISLAGSTEVQPVRPLAALMAPPPAGDAETFVQGSVTSPEPSRLPILPPAGSTEVQPVRPLAASTSAPPAGDAETAMQSSAASRELVPSPPPRRVHKSRPRRAHNVRNVSNKTVPILPPAGSTEVQPVRPLAASTSAPPAGDAETAMQSSAVSRELVPSPPPRRVHKSHPRRAHNVRNVSNNTVPQPVRPLAASTSAPPAGDAETAMQSSAVSRELVA